MRLLLDTHALLWWWKNDPSLSGVARAAIVEPANDVFVSAVSAVEIAIKVRKGKLPELRETLPHFIDDLARDGFTPLPVTVEHGLLGGGLSPRHDDPFDRLLAAQALLDDLTLVSRDREIAAFGCRTLW